MRCTEIGAAIFVTPKEGERVDKSRLTPVGRALKELGIQMIAACSAQARGRSEPNFGTWQGRPRQELRLAGVTALEDANRFLSERYVAEFNRRFTVQAAERGTAFRPCVRRDLERVFTAQTERVVSKDNTAAIRDRWWQLDKCSLAGATVTIHEHLDQSVSIRYGAHVGGRYDPAGQPLGGPLPKGRGKGAAGDSHFPTASNPIQSLSPKPKAKKVA